MKASQHEVRGPHPSAITLDEIVEIKPTLIDAARAQLITTRWGAFKHGRELMSSTAQIGPSTHFFQDIIEGAPENGFLTLRWGCWECDWMDREHLNTVRKSTREQVWLVEYEGQFGTVTGQIFNGKQLKNIQAGALEPRYEYSSPRFPTYLGIDWGNVHPTVLTAVQVQSDQKARVIDVWGEPGVMFSTWLDRVKAWNNKYKFLSIFVDNSHIGEKQRLLEAGLPVEGIPFGRKIGISKQWSAGAKITSSDTEKGLMIDNLHWLFDRKLIEVHPSWKDTVKEIKRYHRVKTPDGQYKIYKIGDDYVDSLMLACRDLRTTIGQEWSGGLDGIGMSSIG